MGGLLLLLLLLLTTVVVLELGEAMLLRKCCPEGQSLREARGRPTCVLRMTGEGAWTPSAVCPDPRVHFAFLGPLGCPEDAFVSARDLPGCLQVLGNGGLVFQQEFYGPHAFCVDEETVLGPGSAVTSRDVVHLCASPADPDAVAIFVPKCCGPRQSYVITDEGHGCALSDRTHLTPDIFDPVTDEKLNVSRAVVRLFHQRSDFCPRESQVPLYREQAEYRVLRSGHLFVPRADHRVLAQDSYCVDAVHWAGREHELWEVAVVCAAQRSDVLLEWLQAETCNRSICVPKCCPRRKAFSNSDSCALVEVELTFEFKDKRGHPVHVPPEDFQVINHTPVCVKDGYILSTDPLDPDDVFYVLPGGGLYLPTGSRTFPFGKFCIDTFVNATQHYLVAAYCEESFVGEPPRWVNVLYPVCMAVSAILLVITLLVYSVVVELRNVHGKTLMAYILSLLLAFLCLIVAQLISGYFAKTSCKTLGVTLLFAFLSTFFWLNVMCFDIWRTLTVLHSGHRRRSDTRRFLGYCCYAWGCPLVISIVVIVADNVDTIPDFVPKPNIGVQRCWFEFGADSMSAFVYFYGPIAVLLLANIAYFLMTAVRLKRACKDTIMVRSHKNRNRALIYLKLFLIMGLVWVSEVISSKVGPPQIWYVTDMANALQGVVIFIIFVCKRSVFRKVKKTYRSYVGRKENGGAAKATAIDRVTSTNSGSSWIRMNSMK